VTDADPEFRPDPAGTGVRAYLGIGSNLGDRVARLQGAVDGLAVTADVHVVGVSPVYETAPVGGPEQPDYLNAVVGIDTRLSPRELLVLAHRLEAEADRVREEHWGPRTLDVDLLLVGDQEVAEPDLVVPHPRMTERAFVLVPLADLDPAWAPRIPPEHADVRPTEIRLSLPE
jgi:2-amino-4-hydroxy-6-hydroxymethyldihydropteridine diphosphokinase